MAAKEHPVDVHDAILTTLRADIDDHENRLRVLEKVSNEREIRIQNLYENIGAIKLLVEQLGIKMDKLSENIDAKLNLAVSDLDTRLKKLEGADGDKWKKFIWLVITAIVAGIMGYLL